MLIERAASRGTSPDELIARLLDEAEHATSAAAPTATEPRTRRHAGTASCGPVSALQATARLPRARGRDDGRRGLGRSGPRAGEHGRVRSLLPFEQDPVRAAGDRRAARAAVASRLPQLPSAERPGVTRPHHAPSPSMTSCFRPEPGDKRNSRAPRSETTAQVSPRESRPMIASLLAHPSGRRQRGGDPLGVPRAGVFFFRPERVRAGDSTRCTARRSATLLTPETWRGMGCRSTRAAHRRSARARS